MTRNFSEQLNAYLKEASLPIRRIARQSGIPHQTIFNWQKGTQPRWYAALSEDLHRLGAALNLTEDEITLLLRLAGCVSARSGLFTKQEIPMESSLRIPKGWFVTGDSPQNYAIGVDPTVNFENRSCITIKAGPQPVDFAALAQVVKADAYQGKRLRFSAAVRSSDVENRAALFMRISRSDGKILAFDNMRNRPLSGTNDWAHHAIVLDVSKDADEITFGVLLAEKGQIWMADVHLETVEKDVPTTDLLEEIAPYFPVNLGFEE